MVETDDNRPRRRYRTHRRPPAAKLTVRIDETLAAALERHAARGGVSKAAVVENALELLLLGGVRA